MLPKHTLPCRYARTCRPGPNVVGSIHPQPKNHHVESFRLLIENAFELLAAIRRGREEKIEISLPMIVTPFADAALPERTHTFTRLKFFGNPVEIS